MDYYEKPHWLVYAIFGVCLLAVGISSYTLVEVGSIKSGLQPTGMAVADFLDKLTAHEALAGYKNVAPVNIIQITNNNLANLQSQIQGLDVSYLGNFIVQYNDRIVIYNLETDEIISDLQIQAQQAQFPAGFFERLTQHTELQGVEAESPAGGVIDAQSVAVLQQQFPDTYKNANAGDYLLRYSDRLIIYNHERDEVIGAFELG